MLPSELKQTFYHLTNMAFDRNQLQSSVFRAGGGGLPVYLSQGGFFYLLV